MVNYNAITHFEEALLIHRSPTDNQLIEVFTELKYYQFQKLHQSIFITKEDVEWFFIILILEEFGVVAPASWVAINAGTNKQRCGQNESMR